MTASAGEQFHRMTENVYRNTIEGFNPELRNLITLGRAYEKASQNVTQVAKDYYDALMRVGEIASESKSARQLGQSLLQIAETYKQIEAEREITLHAFRKELLNPIEAKIEEDCKSILQAQKTYQNENKAKSEAVEKCRTELKKIQKKAAKNHSEKYVEKEQKSSEELQHLTKQLYDFRNEGLRDVWSKERKRYCHVVDRYCSLIKNDSAFFSKAQSVLRHRMPKWTESCAKPEKLSEECEDTLSTVYSGPLGNPLQMELRSSKRLYERNILLAQSEEHRGKEKVPTPGQSHEAPERPASADMTDVQSSANYSSATLPNPKRDKGSGIRHTKSMIQHVPQGVTASLPRNSYLRRVSEGGDNISTDVQKLTKVQAMYSHIANTESQLNFNEGDIIGLVGPKNNGWYYGHNFCSKKSGWFPIAYTHPVQTNDNQQNGNRSPLAHPTQNPLSTGTPPPHPPLSSNPAFNKGMAASLDNILDGRNQYPSPDYGGGNSPGVAPAVSTMSLPHSLLQGTNTNHAHQTEGPHGTEGTNGHGHRSPTSSISSSASMPSQPSRDNASIEEEDSSVFSSVQLRRTVTNDRSAPLIPKDYTMNELSSSSK